MELTGPILLKKQTYAQTELLFGISLGATIYGSSCIERYQQYLSTIEGLGKSGVSNSAELDEVTIWVRTIYLGQAPILHLSNNATLLI